MSVRPERIDDVVAFRRLALSSRQLSRPRNPIWLYPVPVTPAVEPDDYLDGYDLYPAWASPWSNISSDREATAFRLFEGHPQYRIAATGGEAYPGSLLFTLPDGFRPPVIQRIPALCGASAERVGAFDVYPNGEILFVGSGVLA